MPQRFGSSIAAVSMQTMWCPVLVLNSAITHNNITAKFLEVNLIKFAFLSDGSVIFFALILMAVCKLQFASLSHGSIMYLPLLFNYAGKSAAGAEKITKIYSDFSLYRNTTSYCQKEPVFYI